jgi:hypothetical protein
MRQLLKHSNNTRELIDQHPNRRAFEATALTAATLIVIWCTRGLWLLLSSIALTSIAVFTLRRHDETLDTLGLGWNELRSAVIAWKWWLLGIAALTLGLRAGRPHFKEWLLSACVYFVWCCFQQFLYQNVIYKGMREKLGPGAASQSLAGLLFAALHLPNPVLVPATLIWGTVSSNLFERQRSVLLLGLIQTLLSNLLRWSMPFSWHHNFKVGPAYFLTH